MAEHDILIKASTLVCPASSIHGPATVGITGDRISHVGTDPSAPSPSAKRTIEISDGLLLPGLVDLHAHPALAGSRFGVDPDAHLLPGGSTTVLSQGDAGARNVDEYIRHTIERSKTGIRLAINFCADGESNPDGRFFSLDEASVTECVDAVRRGGSHIWGISLNIAQIRGSDVDPIEVLRRGIQAAEETHKPVMFGATKDSNVPLADQLKWLRPGDVMTYCFHSGEGSIVEDGRVQDCVWEARERGVLFDVGDGYAAFGFDTAEAAIAEGFLPDTISSDFYRAHVDAGMEHDLPLVTSKLIAAGMDPNDCWPSMTSAPASVLGLEGEIGRVQEGAQADLCVVKPGSDPETLRDGHDQVRSGIRWRPVMTIKSGSII